MNLLAGNRPYLLALVVVLALGAMMLVTPMQQFLDGRDRVDHLQAQVGALTDGNTALEAEVEALSDPEGIELRAREELGLVKPGEVPYAIVPPEVDRPQIEPPPAEAEESRPWWQRWWGSLADLFG